MRQLFACVADNATKYLTQALRLLQSLRWFGATHASADFVVAVVEQCPDAYRREYEALGARVEIVPRASDWHGPSNKLEFLRLPALSNYHTVTLLDCDVIVAGDVSAALAAEGVRAKPADLCTLPDDVLRDLHAALGIALPGWRTITSIDRIAMLPYCNTGVVVLAGETGRAFAAHWLALHERVLAHRELLREHGFYADQASFALALSAFGHVFEPLAIALNFPGHIEPARYPPDVAAIEPLILHYHHRVDGRTGGLLKLGLPGVDAVVDRFNARLSQERRSAFSNAVFWDTRYHTDPELGSGIGSRGEHASYKAGVIQRFVDSHGAAAIADFGCGDGVVVESLRIHDYLGVDGSAEVVARNRVRYPQRRFVCEDIVGTQVRCDYSLCLDVLIHQPTPAAFRATVAAVVQATARAGLINGLDDQPTLRSDIVFFHGALRDELQALGVQFRAIGGYRDTVIYEWWR